MERRRDCRVNLNGLLPVVAHDKRVGDFSFGGDEVAFRSQQDSILLVSGPIVRARLQRGFGDLQALLNALMFLCGDGGLLGQVVMRSWHGRHLKRT